ncbi:MAG: hypothetical protein IJ301_04010 [Clostridia bacterium]|nr:hypothetical protein [Clostridia bacterium]
MSKTKSILLTTSIALIVALVAVFVGSYYLRATSTELTTRDINVNEIGMLSYEEKVDQLLNEFDVYSYDYTNTEITFEGSLIRNLSDITGYQKLNTIDDSEVTKTYSTKFNVETETFTLITKFEQSGVVIKTTEESVIPYYDSTEDDYFIPLEDGTALSVAEALKDDNFNECVAIVDDAAILVAAALAITIVVAAPVIVDVVTTVVTQVVTWVKSFWSWFRSLFTKKTVTVTSSVVTTTITYPITISGTTYKLKKYEKTRYFDPLSYYLALADTDDGFMYISTTPINESVARAVIYSATFVPSAHQNSKKSFVASVYTENQARASNIAATVGSMLGCPGNIHHYAMKIGYFSHYHPGSIYHEPHVFYGFPRIV